MIYDWLILQVWFLVVVQWLFIFCFRTRWFPWKQLYFVHILKLFSAWCTTGPLCRSDFFQVQKWSESDCTMFGYFFISEHTDLNESNFISYTFWKFLPHNVRLALFAGHFFFSLSPKVVKKWLYNVWLLFRFRTCWFISEDWTILHVWPILQDCNILQVRFFPSPKVVTK